MKDVIEIHIIGKAISYRITNEHMKRIESI